jgi:hypothetical protein
MKRKWPDKDPDEVLDYGIRWAGRIGNDTIATSTWTVPSGIFKERDDHDGSTTTLWLSGGVLDATYEFLNRITTAGGRRLDQTVTLKMKAH